MELSQKEWWGLVHGMGFGAVFLLAFTGGIAGLYSLRPGLVTDAGIRERMIRLKIGVAAMAIAAWGTVITGTWIVYPWYRAKTVDSPKSILLLSESTKGWHEFGMEWKEHIAWISPILATVAAFIVIYFGSGLIKLDRVRKIVITLFLIAFFTAAIAGIFGALITKVAPVK